METIDRMRNLSETLGEPEELEYIRGIIKDHEWKFAKTYASFCPHEYTLRHTWQNKADYRKLVNFIWRYGLVAQYGNTEPKTYWFDHETGWYYFIFDEDVDSEGMATDKATLINRARIEDYEFWVDSVQIVRCRAKRK